MTPDPRFLNMPDEFWASVRAVSEAVGYTVTLKGYFPIPRYLQGPKIKPSRNSQLKVPAADEVRQALLKLGLNPEHLLHARGDTTAEGQLLLDYLSYRAGVLNGVVEAHLMDAPQAKKLFQAKLKSRKQWECPLPRNNQGKAGGANKFLTCLVNMIICEEAGEYICNLDPQKLVRITQNGRPVRTLARRVDGTFLSPVDPVALWEIKEYYYTTTFGSAISRGVFETQLDGMELAGLPQKVWHYLFIDSHYTWWSTSGKPYLCRIVDLMHQGHVDEVLVGREILDQLPSLVRQWVTEAKRRGLTYR
jgi:hypothetical protein